MLFYILALLPFLPLYLAAPKAYNPFPPPNLQLTPRSDHGRAGFSPEMLAAYKTAEATGVTPVYNVMERGRHYKRGVSILESRAVGQGRRSKVRIVRRAATTCVPIPSSSSTKSTATSSASSTSSSAAYTSKFATIRPPGAVSRTSSSVASASTSQSMVSSSKSSVSSASRASVSASASRSSASSSSSSRIATSTSSSNSSAAPTSTKSTPSSSISTSSVKPTPSSSSTRSSTSSAKPSPTSAARITQDRGGDGPFSGWGTWFDVGLGACGVWDTPDHPIVAISAELMDNWPGISPGYNPNNHPLCGQHLKITWRGKSTLARVADRCPGCAVRSLDMSKGLFEHFATLDVGLLGMDSYTGNITWSWVEGSGSLPSLPFTP